MIAVVVVAVCAAPAHAQASPTAEQAIQREKEVYGPPPPKPRCGSGGPDEIVVCAPESGDQFRVPSTAETDPSSRAARRALDGNIPTAPDLKPHYPGPVAASGCFIPPCPGEPAYLIDFSTIPDAPPGSDADLIAKGEKPAP